MKHLTTIKDNQWIWPIGCDYTWDHINGNDRLYNDILPYLKSTNVMVQAGGNCGRVMKPFLNIFKHIYTFEPNPLNFYCLVNNLTGSNVYKFQACLGNEHKMVSMDTIYPNDNGAFYVSGKGNIPTLKIDDLNLDECDFIQLDIEGFEYQALLGGIETIKKYYPVICVEWHKDWAGRYGNTFENMNGLLSDLGYSIQNTNDADLIYVKLD
jgi:FkbM family methyltransferase